MSNISNSDFSDLLVSLAVIKQGPDKGLYIHVLKLVAKKQGIKPEVLADVVAMTQQSYSKKELLMKYLEIRNRVHAARV